MPRSLRYTLYCLLSIIISGNATAASVQQGTKPLSGLNLEDFNSNKQSEVDWGTNPFVKYGDAFQTKQMALYGIIIGPGKSMALINSDIVKVGDKLGTSEVIAIEKQKVILRNADGLYQISFRGMPNEKT